MMKTATIINDLSGSGLNGVKVKVVTVMPPSTMFGLKVNAKNHILRTTGKEELFLCVSLNESENINRFYDREGGDKSTMPKNCISFMSDGVLYKGDDVFSEEELKFDE